ncbi:MULTISPECIES: hypothetical protein [Nostoc]|uniref:Uncharacterized protein n=1 Tax=Nostoc paludosum FACHB-159 TaxID=2692908 RepID=A0ABR8K434_9NOSO|nr:MULTISPECIES: hypothetical protein [Nostoc]MBD2677204.1 hypothetical protein [Nostoc sp. FACHB-857]MBD2732987.1 hypothetical protein [Nostoc paludosum FACHB-159]
MANTNQAIASSKLMQNYRISTPVSSDTQIVAVGKAGDGSRVFSIASNRHLFMIESTTESDTGWRQLDLNMNGEVLTLEQPIQAFAAATDGQGNDHLVAIAATPNDPSSNSIYYVKNFETAPESERWIFCGRMSNVTIVKLGVGFDANQQPLVAIVTEKTDIDSTNKYAIQILHLKPGQHPIPWSPLLTTSKPNRILDLVVGSLEPLGNGVIVSYIDENGAPRLEFSGVPAYHHIIARGGETHNILAVVSGTDGNSMLFAAAGSNLYFNDPNLGLMKMGTLPAPIDRVAAIRNQNGVVDVFVHTTDAKIYHAVPGVQDPVEILQKAAHMGVAQSGDGTENLFYVGFDHTLWWLVRDRQTRDWDNSQVELDTTQQIEAFSSYSTAITLLDRAQTPMAYTDLQITSSATMNVAINGQTYIIDATTPASCTTNAAGQVILTSSTNKLSTSVLSISGDFLPDGHAIEVQPNTDIQNTLETITADQLLQAKKADGSSLLQGNYSNQDVANALQKGLNQTMSLGKTQPSDPQNTQDTQLMFARSDRPESLRYRAIAPTILGELHLASVTEQHWEMDFTSGIPVYGEHTADSITPHLETIVQPLALRALGSLSNHSVGFSWGDLWQGIKDGVIELGKLFVSTVVDPVTKFVKQVVVKIEDFVGNVLWNGAINLLEQVFDIAEGIFQNVKIFFEDLFDWLGFLFNWNDILRSKEAIKYTFNQFIPVIQAGLTSVKNRVIGGIDAFERNIQSTFEGYIQQIAATQTITQVEQTNVKPQPSVQSNVVTNIFYTGFINHASSTQITDGGTLLALSPESNSAIDNLVVQLTNYAQQFQSVEAFTRAVDYFSQIKKNPDQILQLAISGLLEVVEGIALLALDMAKTIIGLVFDGVIAALGGILNLLNQEWNIPFVSDLYSFITNGSQLSALDLLALIVAIPGTVVYKIIFQEAPFPDDASLQTFKSVCTTQNLLGASGLANQPSHLMATRAEAAQATEISLKSFKPLFDIFYSVNYFFYGGFEAILDIIPPDDVSGGFEVANLSPRFTKIRAQMGDAISVLSVATLGLEFTSQVFSIPWVVGGGSVGCDNDTDFGNLIWVLQWIGVGFDCAWFAVTSNTGKEQGRLARNSGDIGTIVDTVWGCTHVGLMISWAFKNNWKDGKSIAQNFLGTLPEFTKILRHTKVIESTEGFSLPALSLIDFVGNEGVCFMGLAKYK